MMLACVSVAGCLAAPAADAPGRESVPAAASPTPTPDLQAAPSPTLAAEPAPAAESTPAAEPAPTLEPSPAGPQRPAWLGTRVLPLRSDGFGEVQPTPPELADRRLPPPSPSLLPPPPSDFSAAVEPVPDDVLARSTWTPECPVGVDDLRYVTMPFWGFDGRPHTGELLVNAAAADDLVAVFSRLFTARFPIEEMRVVAAEELDLPPTGDGNNTTVFVCRPVTGGTRWSEHAYGLAIDINPFHNPYARGDLVVPELASAYVDRDWQRPGMIQPGDVVTTAFAEIGWAWGGSWRSVKDWMHFSASGR